MTERREFPAWLEYLLLVAVFGLAASWLPPDPNEAHYLCKSRHYWEPEWCGRDFFLASSDSHACFYLLFGWIARLMPLLEAAWCGRVLTWLAMAWGWQRLSFAVLERRGWSILAAAAFVMLNERFHQAGEWVVGGFESKGFGYAMVFAALAEATQSRWNRAWILGGAAAGIHVLVGGWAIVALLLAWLTLGDRPRICDMLPGLLPALSLSRGVPADVALQASEIYVYQRLPHHLWPPGFVRTGIERFTMLSFVWLGMIALVPDNGRQAVIRRVVCAALLIAVAGGVIAASAIWYPAQAAQLLRYYWFRLADAMVPLGVALAGVATIARAVADPARQRAGRIALAATGIAVAVHLVTNFNEQQRLGVPRADGPGKVWNYADWRDACAWIEAETPTDALFLTPRSSQTFKWYAQRAEVITWKDVPQGPQRSSHGGNG